MRDAVVNNDRKAFDDAKTEYLKAGGTLAESWLDEGFILAKPPGVGQPTRVENALPSRRWVTVLTIMPIPSA